MTPLRSTPERPSHVLTAVNLAMLSMRMRPIEQILVGLSGRDLRDIRPLQAAQASIKRVRHLLWHGRPVLIASPSSGQLSLMEGSEPPPASGWRLDRPASFHSLPDSDFIARAFPRQLSGGGASGQ